MTEFTPPTPITLGTDISRIVVPVALAHEYDRGVAAAASLAERFGLSILLVNVDVTSDDAVSLDHGAEMTALQAAVIAAHPMVEVDDLVLAAGDDPVPALAGHLAKSDLVLLATDAMESPAGSFAQRLAGASHSPVLMFGPQAVLGDLTGDVVVAVDGSVLAERIIPAALGFAAALGSNVKFVETVPASVTDHVRRLKERGERVSENAYLRDLVERLDDPRVSWEVIHAEEPAPAVCAAAEKAGAAMIAMATHGRGGFVAQVFGSVTLETVHRAPCPVLVQCPVSESVVRELAAT